MSNHFCSPATGSRQSQAGYETSHSRAFEVGPLNLVQHIFSAPAELTGGTTRAALPFVLPKTSNGGVTGVVVKISEMLGCTDQIVLLVCLQETISCTESPESSVRNRHVPDDTGEWRGHERRQDFVLTVQTGVASQLGKE